MKRILMLAVTVAVAAVAIPIAAADNDPYPAAKGAGVFVAGQTATVSGAISNYFAPGSSIVFRAYAVDAKTKQAITSPAAVKYFYVAIPNQPNVKLTYNPKAAGASGAFGWTGTWSVPAGYPTGPVAYKVWVRTKTNKYGLYVQQPVATAVLTIVAAPPAPPGPPPAPAQPPASSQASLGINADAVNGTRPAAAAPRPIGCTQTNVFRRGEQLVVRAWGFDLATGDLLTNDNVDTASFSVPGQPAVTLNWGTHGATGQKVYFWANAWNIPTDYPLGDVTITVTFKTVDGKTGTFAYPITVNP
jgi:hypothetical protein